MTAPRPSALRHLLLRRCGGKTADRILRGCGVLGIATLAVGLAVPAALPLVPFFLYTIWTNGPYSPVLPAAYEPVLMLFGRLYPPILIGALGTLGTVLVEYLNYHVYAAGVDRLPDRVRSHRTLRRVAGWYARAPFLTIVVLALGPLPYWLARILSALNRYSLPRHLAATAVGRFPRLWFFAALAAPFAIPTSWLVAASVGVSVTAVLVVLWGAVRARVVAGRASAPHHHVSGRIYVAADAGAPD